MNYEDLLDRKRNILSQLREKESLTFDYATLKNGVKLPYNELTIEELVDIVTTSAVKIAEIENIPSGHPKLEVIQENLLMERANGLQAIRWKTEMQALRKQLETVNTYISLIDPEEIKKYNIKVTEEKMNELFSDK